MKFIDILLPVVALASVSILLFSPIRKNAFWRATITPLASIIGSGFLIVAPLLAKISGNLAPLAMVFIVVVAITIGSVIRFNIRYSEPILSEISNHTLLKFFENSSRTALIIAYTISITFYLRLMSAFVLNYFPANTGVWEQSLTTGVLLLIGMVGFRQGLGGLEKYESISVSIKLAIIVSLFIGLALYDAKIDFDFQSLESKDLSWQDRLSMLAGMLLVVQGFETSRYLGKAYSPNVRIKSMLLAQCISAVIYTGFIILMMPLMAHESLGPTNETGIITLTESVAFVLPAMLIFAAVMSQFSAAIADTVGAGGLVEEQSNGKIQLAAAYLIVAFSSSVLVWTTNIFEIISLASRAFAAYYFIQTILALHILKKRSDIEYRRLLMSLYVLVAVTLLAVLLFAKSVE